MSGIHSSLMEALGESLYIIWRHGGKFQHNWRAALKTHSLTEAKQCYEKYAAALRRGTVELREHPYQKEDFKDGKIWYSTTASGLISKGC